MDLQVDVHKLLQDIGAGYMASTAYDTAWIARLIALDEPMAKQALEWLREHQLPDGSWGVAEFRYFHDRLICTLAAMTALEKWGDVQDRNRLRRARLGIDTAIKGLRADTVGETVGFEMIAPALLQEARSLNVLRRASNDHFLKALTPEIYYPGAKSSNEGPRRRQTDVLGQLGYRRIAKLQALPKGKISRYVTVAFSAEMVGTDGIHLLDIDNLQEANGSVGHSPSATAHFALHARPEDPAALAYLRETVSENGDGGSPDVAPFDVFERAWTLWNLSLTGQIDAATLEMCQPHLDFLEDAWHPGIGAGFAAGYTPKDGDETALTFEVLTRFGRKVDMDALLYYEEEEHFRCYALEANPSTSTNIHLLSALRQAGLESQHPASQKIINFLQRVRYLGMVWFDKWHVSPYYPTTHAIIAAEQYADDLVLSAVNWLLETQNKDGSWGYYVPTAEETAYCLQALLIWRRGGKLIPDEPIQRGLDWLVMHMEPPYPPLWIGKSLYVPVYVVRSAILSALMLGAQE